MALDIEISKDGYKILSIEIEGKRKYLGSKYNQKREIDEFIKSLGKISEKDNFIILGLGFCEHIKEMLGLLHKSNKVMVIELNSELINYCNNNYEMKKVLDDNRVIVLKEKSDIDSFFDRYVNEGNINFLKVNSYCKYSSIFLDELKIYTNIIKDKVTERVLKRNTIISNGTMYLSNVLSNLKFMAKLSQVNLLKDKYKNKPAIIVSAGPSLSKNIDQLKGLKKALIFTGGRTLKPLLERNIIPSCLGVVDPSIKQYKFIEEYIDEVNCPLFFSDTTPSIVIEKYKGSKFFDDQHAFISKAFSEKIPSLYGGGSTAHSLTNLALYMGCNPVIFIGQDLAFTDEKVYDSLADSNIKTQGYEMKNSFFVEDVYGNKVKTGIELDSFRKSLETIVAKHSDTIFINATEGGANIKGTVNKKLSEVIDGLNEEKILPIDLYLKNIDNSDKLIDALKVTLKECDRYLELCNRGKQVANQCVINRKLREFDKVMQNEHEFSKIHSQIQSNLEKINLLNSELSRIIYDVEGDSELSILSTDSEEIIFNKKIKKIDKLYSGISKVIIDNYGRIENVIKELKKEK